MVEVNICSFDKLWNVINLWKPDTIISAIKIGMPSTNSHRIEVPIEDIYAREIILYKDAIREVLACTSQRILIHCWHGRSRSAALAIAKIYSVNPDGVATFLEEHPEAEPNALLLLFADEILGAEFDLLRRCKGRYKGHEL